VWVLSLGQTLGQCFRKRLPPIRRDSRISFFLFPPCARPFHSPTARMELDLTLVSVSLPPLPIDFPLTLRPFPLGNWKSPYHTGSFGRPPTSNQHLSVVPLSFFLPPTHVLGSFSRTVPAHMDMVFFFEPLAACPQRSAAANLSSPQSYPQTPPKAAFSFRGPRLFPPSSSAAFADFILLHPSSFLGLSLYVTSGFSPT